jgi:zinc/manganese transport system substrate-binding protein
MKRTAAVLAALAFAGPAVGACSASTTAKDGRIHLVAGENFWGNIAQQIGGDHVDVTSIITDPNTDPHEYESSPTDAAAVARASIVIENGVGYDDFLSRLLSAAGGRHTVLSVATIVGVGGNNPNPHLWYDPTYVLEASAAIEKQLAASDPADADTFAANLTIFTRAYQPYLDTISTIKSKYAGTAISYTERVPGYLVAAAGLRLGTPASFSQAVEDGTDPTPADTATFDADIAQKKVKALLYNAQVTDEQTAKIKAAATAAGVPIVGVTETIPAGEPTFQAWQIAQAKALLAALGG